MATSFQALLINDRDHDQVHLVDIECNNAVEASFKTLLDAETITTIPIKSWDFNNGNGCCFVRLLLNPNSQGEWNRILKNYCKGPALLVFLVDDNDRFEYTNILDAFQDFSNLVHTVNSFTLYQKHMECVEFWRRRLINLPVNPRFEPDQDDRYDTTDQSDELSRISS
jgi:hypothetical protein